MFFDEFGFSFQEPLARTWAPKGKRPIVRRVERNRRAVSTAMIERLVHHAEILNSKGASYRVRGKESVTPHPNKT